MPDEEAARSLLKDVEPGQYSLPHAADGKVRQSEEWQQKWIEGPGAMIIVMQTGSLSMGKQLGQWFAYAIVISFLTAYVTSVALPAGANYLQVFQIVGTVAALAYAGYRQSAEKYADQTNAVLLCGSNFDNTKIQELIARN